MIGRKRPFAPSMIAVRAGTPSRSFWSVKSIITRESLTTTPANPKIPTKDSALTATPSIQ